MFYIQVGNVTAQKMKFSIKDFFSECNQVRSFLRIWSNSLKKSLMKDFILVQWSGHYSLNCIQSINISNKIITYPTHMTLFKLRSMFCGKMFVKIIDSTQVTIQPFVCSNLVHRPNLQNNIGFTRKTPMWTYENWQRMPKNRGNALLFGEKFVIPILNNKYMPY